MACTSATWGTSSLQLRLALNCENCRKSYGVLVRTRLKKLDRQVRVLCVAQNDERPRNESRWNGLGSSADTFAGGWGSDNDEHSIGSLRKNRFGGVVGAAVAGVILVAGLSFAAFSLSRRNASRLKQQMEPLTHEQEVSLASISDIGEINVYGNEGDNVKKQENRSLESKAEIDQDHSSSSEYKDAAIENKIDDDIKNSLLDDAKDTISGSDIIYDVSIQEKHESALDDVSVAPEMISSSSNFPEPEIFIDSSYSPSHKDSDGSVSATITEPYEIGGSLIAVESTDFSNSTNLHIDLLEGLPSSNVKETSNLSLDSSVESDTYAPNEPVAVSISISSQLDTSLDPQIVPTYNMEEIASASAEENPVLNKMLQVSVESNISSIEMRNLSKIAPSATELESAYRHEKNINEHSEVTESRSSFESPTRRSSFLPAGIPAPSVVSAALRVQPGKVLVPAVVDQVQCQALAALQVLKVIEAHAQPTDLCTRREYARWLVSASSALSRNTVSKVYPAMYIENVTELAFDDITPEDPDFSSIQGLAEAGLISSKLSNRDLLNDYVGPLCFSPESPLSRQDIVSWKMALEKRQLPEADRKILYHLSGFVDIDKINPDAWPALIADLSAGEQGIIALAFGCTRLFQPAKPVTKAQAAVALATGEASDIVSEELARIEAESMAENAVSAHNALVAQVEKDINATFEKELSMEREKIDAVEKMAEQARSELEKLRAEREVENIALLKERAAIESEMEVLSRLRREVEEQLQSLMSNKVEISYEKERINKLRKEAEDENQEISRLQYELEVERKALSMARAWAEDEAKRAREQAKALEEARDRWERHGIKVVVDNDLREESTAGVTWLNAGNQISVEGTVNRAENLVEKLKVMADDVRGKSREIISKVLQYIQHLITFMKEWASIAGRKTEELKGKAGTKARELKDSAILKAGGSIQELQQGTAQFSLAVKEGAKRVAEDCREGVEKLTHKFKT